MVSVKLLKPAGAERDAERVEATRIVRADAAVQPQRVHGTGATGGRNVRLEYASLAAAASACVRMRQAGLKVYGPAGPTPADGGERRKSGWTTGGGAGRAAATRRSCSRRGHIPTPPPPPSSHAQSQPFFFCVCHSTRSAGGGGRALAACGARGIALRGERGVGRVLAIRVARLVVALLLACEWL